MVEYLLVLFIIVGAVIVVSRLLKSSRFFYENVTKPIVAYLRYNYKYGSPRVQGWDEGTPKGHIQVTEPAGTNFRIVLPKDI